MACLLLQDWLSSCLLNFASLSRARPTSFGSANCRANCRCGHRKAWASRTAGVCMCFLRPRPRPHRNYSIGHDMWAGGEWAEEGLLKDDRCMTSLQRTAY